MNHAHMYSAVYAAVQYCAPFVCPLYAYLLCLVHALQSVAYAERNAAAMHVPIIQP